VTIEQVILKVEDQTGQKVTADTPLSELELDSLEFLDLLVQVGVLDVNAPRLHTVKDIYLAAQP
jgi:Phosphopantetheine attachment site